MIKKFIGMLFSAAAIAVMVFVVLGRDRYRSLIGDTDFVMPSLFRSGPKSAAEPKPEQTPASAPASASDDSDAGADYLDDDELRTPDLFSSDDY